MVERAALIMEDIITQILTAGVAILRQNYDLLGFLFAWLLLGAFMFYLLYMLK